MFRHKLIETHIGSFLRLQKSRITYCDRDIKHRYTSIRQLAESSYENKDIPRVLDAGGGKQDVIPNLLKKSYTINTCRNSFSEAKHVDYFVVANIEIIPFADKSFDLVCCLNVLEHVVRPKAALRELLRVVKDGGLLFLAGPIPNSLQGLITRATPFRFHVWVYKALGVKTAGLPGAAPFPTYFAEGSRPEEVFEMFQDDCILLDANAYESIHARRIKNKSAILYGAYLVINYLVYITSFGRVLYKRADFALIFKKLDLGIADKRAFC